MMHICKTMPRRINQRTFDIKTVHIFIRVDCAKINPKAVWTDQMMLQEHIVVSLWASYQICKIAGCACTGNAGNVFPRRRFQMKPLVSDPGMHHDTCVTHVPWCMSGSLTCGDEENIPGIPGACALAILRIRQEAHGQEVVFYSMSVTEITGFTTASFTNSD